MRTQRIARNLPCWKRYVLQVSQMVLDTLPIDSCTGSALVCLYCTSPKIAPAAQIRMPRYIKVRPLTPPSPLNVTGARSGILISASLPRTGATPHPARIHRRANQDLRLNIILCACLKPIDCLVVKHLIRLCLASNIERRRVCQAHSNEKPGKAKRTALVFSLVATGDLLQQKAIEDGISLDRSGQRHRWGHPLLVVGHRRQSPGHSFSVEHAGREYHRVLRHWHGCGRRRRRRTGSSEPASVRSPVFDDGRLRWLYHVFLL